MVFVGFDTSSSSSLCLKRDFYKGLLLSVSLLLDTSLFLSANFPFKGVQSIPVPFDVLQPGLCS